MKIAFVVLKRIWLIFLGVLQPPAFFLFLSFFMSSVNCGLIFPFLLFFFFTTLLLVINEWQSSWCVLVCVYLYLLAFQQLNC